MAHVLRLDASVRRTGSVTRSMTDRIVERLAPETVTVRDLAEPLPLITADWVAANFTDSAERTATQRETLRLSDTLIAELRAADTIVIGLPIYNFGVTAGLKAWIDLVARARETFRYTEAGPEGLLKGKRAIVAVASGGTEVGSAVDFATPYLRQALGFIGIDDITIIRNDGQMLPDADARAKAAEHAIEALAA